MRDGGEKGVRLDDTAIPKLDEANLQATGDILGDTTTGL